MDKAKAITEVAEELEGSEFVHDPDASRYGITQGDYDTYRLEMGETQRSVEFIERQEFIDIYERYYWRPLKCADMPDGLDFALFQLGVNVGNVRAGEMLQSIVGATVDGEIGPKTIAKVKAYGADLIDELLKVQDRYYEAITAKNPARNQKYLRGWLNRTIKVRIFLATGLTQSGVITTGIFGTLLLALLAFTFLKAILK